MEYFPAKRVRYRYAFFSTVLSGGVGTSVAASFLFYNVGSSLC